MISITYKISFENWFTIKSTKMKLIIKFSHFNSIIDLNPRVITPLANINYAAEISDVIICHDLRYVTKLGVKQYIEIHSAFFICRKN